MERKQIEDALNVRPLVSLSDHDNIEAGCQLRVLHDAIPISVEWTVPIGDTYFHLGVHNLPAELARDLMGALAGYTEQPSPGALVELLDLLHSNPQTLIILNHPLWDQNSRGPAAHRAHLHDLLARAGRRIHALELNGLRPWQENRGVGSIAAELGFTLVSGGDRHGCEPNAILNLTNASTFSEFAEEVRDGVSEVLFMPQYREPLPLRCMQTLCDVLRESPGVVGYQRWSDRVFFNPKAGETIPISAAMKSGGPAVLRYFIAGTSILGKRRVRRALRLCLNEERTFAL